MDSSIPISIKETPLSQEQSSLSKKRRLKKLKPLIFFSIFILLILIAGSMFLSSIFKKSPKPDAYLSGSSKYFCHLTHYPDLCYTSMSSIINTTALKSGPGPIFTTSILLAINQLNSTATSITKALSMNNPTIGQRLSKCRKLVHYSLSHLNDSLATSDVEWLSYGEIDEFGARAKASRRNAHNCFLALNEKDDKVMVGGEDEKVGVEEVKMGVDKAYKLIDNTIKFFQRREDILFDFYNPFYSIDDYGYVNDYYYKNNFVYNDLICFYCVLYLFIALLYFLFWRGN